MFKIDQVNNFFDCDVCHKLLVDPITTPCGYSICKKHLDKLLSEKAYKCRICREEHSIPKEGLVINKRIQNGLNIKLNTLKLNPVFDECKERLLKARSNLSRIETLQKEPENFIYEYFEEIKRKVDLRRECLKLKIDSYYNDMIKSIEGTKVNCMRLSKEVNRLTTDLEKSKKQLTELLERFDTFLISDKKFEDIKESACVINQSLAIIFKEYTDSLIGNKKYSFEFKEFQIEDVFGRFVEVTLSTFFVFLHLN
jgi:chromosome segregation ATPase